MVLRIMATVQLRNPTRASSCTTRRVTRGQDAEQGDALPQTAAVRTSYRTMLTDYVTMQARQAGRTRGNDLTSSVAGFIPARPLSDRGFQTRHPPA